MGLHYGTHSESQGAPPQEPSGTSRNTQGPSRDPPGTPQGIPRSFQGPSRDLPVTSREPLGTLQGPPGTPKGSSGTFRELPGTLQIPGALQGSSRNRQGPPMDKIMELCCGIILQDDITELY